MAMAAASTAFLSCNQKLFLSTNIASSKTIAALFSRNRPYLPSLDAHTLHLKPKSLFTAPMSSKFWSKGVWWTPSPAPFFAPLPPHKLSKSTAASTPPPRASTWATSSASLSSHGSAAAATRPLLSSAAPLPGLVGRYARVGTMMAKESVKKRLESEQGMSYTEFTYQLLQGYDFLYLFENEGVSVQFGGSDQWGNITAGTELIRKILQTDGAYGLTFPLLLKSDGTKFGKSEDGAIWLSPAMLSPYKFYQYFFSVPDADVVRFLKILTFLDMDEIMELEVKMRSPSYVPNTAQRRLAEEATRFVHGQEGLDEALKATEALRPGAETKLDWKTIEGIAKDVPSCSFVL
ncbi:Tyrosine--tRNA ligase, chloroplastic/mitochondrial [Vitis vinifera]|uniref:Tyrosine--tRNA ligase n=1 Tax=Vitis vinifera TaxID=29760 RepID=A0A438J9D4_VITVI|nr:Tyrosine--tRNA ligase, chloroplastic/mitochondrial [Vitis vinifera]